VKIAAGPFHEKAGFVKADVAALLPGFVMSEPSFASLPSALSWSHSDSVHAEVLQSWCCYLDFDLVVHRSRGRSQSPNAAFNIRLGFD
jgi:hypothetical protein